MFVIMRLCRVFARNVNISQTQTKRTAAIVGCLRLMDVVECKGVNKMALTICGEPNCFICPATDEECSHRDPIKCTHAMSPSTKEGRVKMKRAIKKHSQDVFDFAMEYMCLTDFMVNILDANITGVKK